jgi:selenide, water dikinase
MSIPRFIDLAQHGGCSKKAPAGELFRMFEKLSQSGGARGLAEIQAGFPDVGIWTLNQSRTVSTIDVVLPMTLDPFDFGEVTVAHVLSDLYAGLATPAFVLGLLGVPRGHTADSETILCVMEGALKKLQEADVELVGGHTMADQEDMFLGFAAVGTPRTNQLNHRRQLSSGDQLVLTKPLGGNLAALQWKLNPSAADAHRDALNSMKQLNVVAADSAADLNVRACTDVTGFGLVGHLHNLLRPSGMAAEIYVSKLPLFDSIRGLSGEQIAQSRQYWHNLEYVKDSLFGFDDLSELLATCVVDSQVSGGLLMALPERSADELTRRTRDHGVVVHVIGEIKTNRPPGSITFTT